MIAIRSQSSSASEIVRRVDDGRPRRGDVLDRFEDVEARLGVDPHGRLVHEDGARAVHQAQGQIEPALHPPRKRANRLAGPVGQPDELEGAIHGGGEIAAREAVQASPEPQVLGGREHLVERGLLGHDPELLLHGERARRQVDAVEEDPPLVGVEEARQHRHRRGLSGAVGPQQSVQLARADLKADPVHGPQGAEGLHQAVRFDHLHLAPRGRAILARTAGEVVEDPIRT